MERVLSVSGHVYREMCEYSMCPLAPCVVLYVGSMCVSTPLGQKWAHCLPVGGLRVLKPCLYEVWVSLRVDACTSR